MVENMLMADSFRWQTIFTTKLCLLGTSKSLFDQKIAIFGRFWCFLAYFLWEGGKINKFGGKFLFILFFSTMRFQNDIALVF